MWIVGPLLILAAVAVVVAYGLATTMGKPWSGNLAYDVVGPDRVKVTYSVTRPAGKSVSCLVVAKEMNHATVGQMEDVIPAGEERTLTRTVEVRTSARPVMGAVSGCRTL